MPSEAIDALYRLTTRLLPGPVADRVLPGRRREFRETGVTRTAAAGRRLLIGPMNSAGQGYAWARAAETLPNVAAASFMYRGADDVFAFTADHVIPVSAMLANGRWRAAQRDAVLSGFTHVILESGRSVLGRDADVRAQVRELRSRGIRVALLWHGSDIRLPSAHLRIEPDSPFVAEDYPDTGILEAIASDNRALGDAIGAPEFVSTPDLLPYAPAATWLPLVVDSLTWADAAARPAFESRSTPVVVHAPTNTALKGTLRIAPVVQRLHDEGVIEYREVRGVPSEQMPAFYASADIVLDQFALGSYGVTAVEAMAAGRLVVGHVGDEVRAVVAERAGTALPIAQSRAADLERVLRSIAADQASAAERAAAGPAFVRALHCGANAAAALQPFLDS